MTTIKNLETGEIVEVQCIIDGEDILADVMGNSGISRVAEDADFVVTDSCEMEWWIEWARIEELVCEARKGADDETVAKHDEIIDDYCYDMETLHEKSCELYGIE